MWAGRRRGIRVRRAQHGPAAPWRSPRPALLPTSHPPMIVLLICDFSITSTGKCYLGITNMNGSRDLARTGQCGGPPCAHLSLDSTHARDCIGFHNERQLTTTQCAEATASAPQDEPDMGAQEDKTPPGVVALGLSDRSKYRRRGRLSCSGSRGGDGLATSHDAVPLLVPTDGGNSRRGEPALPGTWSRRHRGRTRHQ